MKRVFGIIFLLGICLSTGIYWCQSRAGNIAAREVTLQELEEMVSEETDFYVYFFSPACKECVKSEPLLKKALEIYPVQMVKMDVKKHEAAQEQFDIPGTPTIFHFQNHKLARGITGGYATYQEYTEFFRQGSGG